MGLCPSSLRWALCPSDSLVFPHVGSWGWEGKKLGAEARTPEFEGTLVLEAWLGPKMGGWGVDASGEWALGVPNWRGLGQLPSPSRGGGPF